MNGKDSQRVNDLFATTSRDITPESVHHAAIVLFAPISHDPEVSRYCASVLSAAELQRADRFVKQADRDRFKQSRAFRRFCGALALGSSQPLSQVVFEKTQKGHPYLSDFPEHWFSFSSCRFGVVGAWSPTHGIGVDIEDQSRGLEAMELARLFFSVAESRLVEGSGRRTSLPTFFKLWCLKEAALKSIGEGLPFGLDAFEFELNPDPHIVHTPPGYGGPDQFGAQLIEGANCCAAVIIRNLV
jgi:4'-phosphopantetheinyl transferase